MCIKSILRMRQRCAPLACALCGIVDNPRRASATCAASAPAGTTAQTKMCRQHCSLVRHLRKIQVPLMYYNTLHLWCTFSLVEKPFHAVGMMQLRVPGTDVTLHGIRCMASDACYHSSQ